MTASLLGTASVLVGAIIDIYEKNMTLVVYF